MVVSATDAPEVDTTDGTGYVLVALDLVDEKTLFIFKILVASATVVMFNVMSLVVFHVLDILEVARAVGIGAIHPTLRALAVGIGSRRGLAGHFSRCSS